MQKGSLIVIGETGGVDPVRWPTGEHARAIVQDVPRRRVRTITGAGDGATGVQPGASQQQQQQQSLFGQQQQSTQQQIGTDKV